MKLEVFKSIVLSVLILFSILLTVAIWNYQPNYESLRTTGHTDPQLNGNEQTKKEIIEPVKAIFHLDNDHYRLSDPTREDELYREIQNLSLLDFNAPVASENGIEGEHIEFFFPLSLSSRVLSDLFNIEEEDVPAIGTFNKFSISLADDGQLSQVEFIDTETSETFIAHTRRTDVAQLMENYSDNEELEEQITFYGKNDSPIYLPAEEQEMYERVYPVNSFAERPELDPLISVLFNDRSVVRQNSIPGGEQHTDGMRQLQVFTNYMEYVDPTAEYEEMNQWNVIHQSVNFINDHNGWTTSGTDEYQLFDVNSRRNTATYRMTYEEYPVFDELNRLATINLTIHNQDVYEYSRPLIQLSDPFPVEEEPVEIGSGERAISLIEQNREVSATVIEDIVIGYKLFDRQGTIQLVPAWYYKDNSGWKEIPVPEVASGGGS